MSTLSFRCPLCHAPLIADDSEAGMTMTCNACSSDIHVPGGQGLRPDCIPVTSDTIYTPHKILGMVCFSLGTRGGMAHEFARLKHSHSHRLATNRKQGQISAGASVGQGIGGIGVDSNGDVEFAGQYAGASFRSDDVEMAFSIAVSELQLRASYLGANAIIGFRWDIDFDSNSNVLNFFGVAYGTAIQIVDEPNA